MAERHADAARRRRGVDELGLRRALADRMLPFLVAAMTFLAALALGGAVAAAALARHWQQGAASALTVQVPQPAAAAADGQGSRVDRVVALLHGTPGITSARAMTDGELADLLRPWLGEGGQKLSLPLPAVVRVRLGSDAPTSAELSQRLDSAAPGTLVESHGIWIGRLSALARSLQACAAAILVVVVAVAAVEIGRAHV